MRTEFMGEEPSLTVLFGEDVEQDIQAVAAETGLPVSAVRSAVKTFAPELLGAESREMSDAEAKAAFPEDYSSSTRGTTFGNVIKALSEAAPNVAAAIRGTGGASTMPTQTTPSFDPMSLLIPGAIAAAILFLVMKK